MPHPTSSPTPPSPTSSSVTTHSRSHRTLNLSFHAIRPGRREGEGGSTGVVLANRPASVRPHLIAAEQRKWDGRVQVQLRSDAGLAVPTHNRQDHLLQLSHPRTSTVLALSFRISTINKLVRVVKLNVIGLLPLVIPAQLIVVVVVALCQVISLSVFFIKFTYQKCLYEYVLLVGVFCGFVSAVENVFETIFALPYLFIG